MEAVSRPARMLFLARLAVGSQTGVALARDGARDMPRHMLFRPPARIDISPELVIRRVGALPEAPPPAGRGTSQPAAKTRPAAVLVPLVDHHGGMTVILTRRSPQLVDHAGQISFPGGRCEADDSGPVATALREAAEEIGLRREQVAVVGCLPLYDTTTGYSVTPVVGIVTPPVNLELDASEVAEAFEIPLAHFLDPANFRRESRIVGGSRRDFDVVCYENWMVWGATAGMLRVLSRILQS